jgi:hypothetical protein
MHVKCGQQRRASMSHLMHGDQPDTRLGAPGLEPPIEVARLYWRARTGLAEHLNRLRPALVARHDLQMEVVSLAERPDLVPLVNAPDLDPGPEHAYYDPVGIEFWPRLYETFPDYQTGLLDEGRLIAKGCSIPLRWDLPDSELPDEGWDFALRQGFSDYEADHTPTALCALWIVVSSEHRGAGLSSVMVRSLRDTAARHDLPVLYAPVAPTRKADYPLIDIRDYARWTLGDGRSPFDPWLRVHWRVGGTILHPCRRSMLVPGSVSDWERWCGLPIPGSGRYVLPRTLAPVDVDFEANLGVYTEPNVWVRHDVN